MFAFIKRNGRIFIIMIYLIILFCQVKAQNWPKIYGDNFDAYVLKAFERL